MNSIWPTELRVSKDKKHFAVSFDNGDAYEFPAEMLRVMSPSAEVQGHSADQRKLISGKKNIEIMKVEPVGNYAVRIVFDDMHDTGIFSWAFLANLGQTKADRWAEYLGELAEKGLTR